MAGKNNAIATGALILTANDDKMLAGMDKAGSQASAKAKDITAKVSKASGGKGGILGSLLGGVAGGIAGAGLFAALVKGPELAMRAFAELEKRATGVDKGALAALKGTFSQLQNAGLGLLQKVVTAAAPAIVGTEVEHYFAIGSGAQFALGALHALHGTKLDAETMARRAVEAAIAFDTYCGGEVQIFRVAKGRKR